MWGWGGDGFLVLCRPGVGTQRIMARAECLGSQGARGVRFPSRGGALPHEQRANPTRSEASAASTRRARPPGNLRGCFGASNLQQLHVFRPSPAAGHAHARPKLRKTAVWHPPVLSWAMQGHDLRTWRRWSPPCAVVCRAAPSGMMQHPVARLALWGAGTSWRPGQLRPRRLRLLPLATRQSSVGRTVTVNAVVHSASEFGGASRSAAGCQ